jgi:hypothetical protein
LDNEQIEPADKGSSENGFVFGQQPKIAAPLLIGLFLVIRSYHTLNGIRASAAVRLARVCARYSLRRQMPRFSR